eukprot:COSAG06_NODE_66_length_26393_cov_6.455161_22_plen_59_part_00
MTSQKIGFLLYRRDELTWGVVEEIVRETVSLPFEFRAPFSAEIDLRHVVVGDEVARQA